MGWTVFLAYDSANNVANSTAPGARGGRIATAWPASSALGFFGNASGGPVTVNTYAVECALLISTATPTVQRYLTNIRPVVGGTLNTGFAISTPGMGATEWYFNRNTDTDFSTPKPSFAPRFVFTTTGAVSFTAASAWFGKVDGSGNVIGSSADTGFRCALAELASADIGANPRGWQMDRISTNKMSMNCDAANGGRQRNNYVNTTGVGWFLAINLAPKSAGAKKGAVAMDITYS